MKNQVNKKLSVSTANKKINVLKWVQLSIGFAIMAAWIIWFNFDCVFISKGITIPEWSVAWDWNHQWYKISNIAATVTLSLTGAYVVLMMAYMVICGLRFKDNIKFYIYQLFATAASFITITICIINAASMMVNEKYVIDIIFGIPLKFEVYHLDYLKWICVAFGCVVFTNVLMLASFRKYEKDILIKDTNLLIFVLACASAVLFIPFMISLGWNDPFVGGAGSTFEWIDLVQNSITWKHVVCQCVTMPMGVFAGMIMVLMVFRLICVVFVYNQKWGEKKSHIAIFSVIGFLTFAAFIVAHANKLDFVKLINDYNSMKLGCLIVVLAQTLCCVAGGVYCGLSHLNYKKRATK